MSQKIKNLRQKWKITLIFGAKIKNYVKILVQKNLKSATFRQPNTYQQEKNTLQSSHLIDLVRPRGANERLLVRAWEIETHFSGGPAVTAREARRFFWYYLPWFLDFIAFETYCMVVFVEWLSIVNQVNWKSIGNRAWQGKLKILTLSEVNWKS